MARKNPSRKLKGKAPAPEATQTKMHKAWELRCANHTQFEIATMLGVDRSTVSRWLDRMRQEDYEAHAATREQHKIDQTRQLEHLASQALRAWEKSKEPLTRARQTTNADGEEITVNEVVEREGNIAYLQTAIKCMADIRAIWGFDVMPAAQDLGGTLADAVSKLQDRVTAYVSETAAQDGQAGNPGRDAGADPA